MPEVCVACAGGFCDAGGYCCAAEAEYPNAQKISAIPTHALLDSLELIPIKIRKADYDCAEYTISDKQF